MMKIERMGEDGQKFKVLMNAGQDAIDSKAYQELIQELVDRKAQSLGFHADEFDLRIYKGEFEERGSVFVFDERKLQRAGRENRAMAEGTEYHSSKGVERKFTARIYNRLHSEVEPDFMSMVYAAPEKVREDEGGDSKGLNSFSLSGVNVDMDKFERLKARIEEE